MNKRLKIFLGCACVTILLVVCIASVVILLHGRSSSVSELPESVEVESTDIPEIETNEDRGSKPREIQGTDESGVSIRIAEDASGLRQGVMLDATLDYCMQNGITGNVLISDADFEEGVFYLTIETVQGTLEFSFKLEDYV